MNSILCCRLQIRSKHIEVYKAVLYFCVQNMFDTVTLNSLLCASYILYNVRAGYIIYIERSLGQSARYLGHLAHKDNNGLLKPEEMPFAQQLLILDNIPEIYNLVGT